MLDKLKKYTKDCNISYSSSLLSSLSGNLTNDIIEDYMNSAEKINKLHLDHCDCLAIEVKNKRNTVVKKEIEEYIQKIKDEGREYDLDTNFYNATHNKSWKRAKELVAKDFSNTCCRVERKQILSTLLLFAQKYDLKDPRAYMIVKSTLNHMLSSIRMQRYSNSEGVMNVWYDRNGNKRLNVNPVEESKREFDKSVIDAISTLDKIFEGSKNVNLNMSIEPKDIKDIFKTNLKEGEYSNI